MLERDPRERQDLRFEVWQDWRWGKGDVMWAWKLVNETFEQMNRSVLWVAVCEK
jgi:hypothetical protein